MVAPAPVPASSRWAWSFLVIVAAGVVGTVATYVARLPTGARGYYNRGVADSHAGRLDSAIRNLDRALELDPRRSDAYVARAMTHLRAGHPYRALTDADAALGLAASARAHLVRGLAWLRAGREDAALDSFDRALEADPGSGRAMIAKGNVLADRGETEAALEAYRGACARRHDDDAVRYAPMLVWSTRLLAGDRAGAESELQDLIRGRPIDRFRLSPWLDAATRAGRPVDAGSGDEGSVLAWIEGVRDLGEGNRARAVESFRRAVATASAESWVRERAHAMLENAVLGFRVLLENPEISSSFSFGPGIEVTCVRPGGAAARAGVAVRDRLVTVAGEDASSDRLEALVERAPVGTTLAIATIRGDRGEDRTLVVGGATP